IKDMSYKTYKYNEKQIDPKKDLYREGPVWGQEGVYFFPNEASYYSRTFYLESRGHKFFILNKIRYDKYVKEGKIPMQVEISVAKKLDFSKPPERPSIEVLGLPHEDVLPDE